MPLHTIDDHAVYYKSAGSGHPLMLIAGLGSNHSFWWKQIPAFSARHRVILLDNRGIGDSPPVSQPFTVADMADDAAALIRALDLGPTHIVGVSMGGFISVTLALRHPELVDHLVLCATSAGGAAHVPPPPEMLDLLVQPDFPDIAARTRAVYGAIAAPGYMAAHPEDMDFLIRDAEEKPPTMETYFHQLGAVHNYTSQAGADRDLHRITAPTLVIHGDTDPLVDYENGRFLATHIKDARFETYAGVGHLVPIEATDRFNADVLDFLQPEG